jgi:hypothetical protein
MWAATFGSFRNTLGSISIAVETARPVTGHLIITELMGFALRVRTPLVPSGMEPKDRDRLTTAGRPVDKV